MRNIYDVKINKLKIYFNAGNKTTQKNGNGYFLVYFVEMLEPDLTITCE